jgi:N-acetylmuramidase
MTLSITGTSVTGAYGYDRTGAATPLPLRGSVTAAGQLSLQSGAEQFSGTLSADRKTFTGTWVTGTTQLPVQVSAAAAGRPFQPSGPGIVVTTGTDASMLASAAIPLTGLRGRELEMARVYNARAGYFAQVGASTGIEAAVIAAVLATESGSAASTTDFASLLNRRMTIRFENHYFYRLWGKSHQGAFAEQYKFGAKNRQGRYQSYLGQAWRPDAKSPWKDFHQSQSGNWEVLDSSVQLNETAALESISMGMGQLMGSNYATLGYSTPQAMFKDLQSSARAQLDGVVNFMLKNARGALQRRDFVAFAAAYNGQANAQVYGALIQGRYNAYLSVLRKASR